MIKKIHFYLLMMSSQSVLYHRSLSRNFHLCRCYGGFDVPRVCMLFFVCLAISLQMASACASSTTSTHLIHISSTRMVDRWNPSDHLWGNIHTSPNKRRETTIVRLCDADSSEAGDQLQTRLAYMYSDEEARALRTAENAYIQQQPKKAKAAFVRHIRPAWSCGGPKILYV